MSRGRRKRHNIVFGAHVVNRGGVRVTLQVMCRLGRQRANFYSTLFSTGLACQSTLGAGRGQQVRSRPLCLLRLDSSLNYRSLPPPSILCHLTLSSCVCVGRDLCDSRGPPSIDPLAFVLLRRQTGSIGLQCSCGSGTSGVMGSGTHAGMSGRPTQANSTLLRTTLAVAIMDRLDR